jgi:preprotein translocase subunit SecG
VRTVRPQLWRGPVASDRGAASFFAAEVSVARIEIDLHMLIGVLLTINIIVCIALIGVVLMQRSEGGALGMGGGGGGFMTARGAGDLLTRTTWILFSIFLIISLALTILTGRMGATDSVVDRLKLDGLDSKTLNTAPLPSGPTAPAPTTTAPAPTASGPATIEAPAPQISAPAPTVSAPKPAAKAPVKAPAAAPVPVIDAPAPAAQTPAQ